MYGLLGVLGFSFTLPATRIASGQLDPLILGPGRGAVAGTCAALWLWKTRAGRPSAGQLRGLGLVALGVVLGFPLLTSLVLTRVPTSRAVIAVGLIPLFTSLFAALGNRERLSLGFWAFALAGASAVIGFALAESGSALALEDLALLLAVVLAALGYAEGGRLSAELGGFAVICWALVLALPCTLACTGFALVAGGLPAPSGAALLAFAYVSLISMLLAFCAWYRGLALGGVARGSQLQLLQPVLSLGWCAALLGEPLSFATLLTGAAVLVSAVGARLAR